MANNRLNFSSLSRASKKLDKLEDLVSRIKKQQEKPPLLVISFLMYADGCVPNMLDIPLSKWKIFENNPGVVVVDSIHEYALREQLTKAKSTLNLIEGEPVFDKKEIPEAPAEARIPYEVFTGWLVEQELIMHGNERTETAAGALNGQ